MQKAIVLLSGGLDSAVAAWLLRPQVEPVLALTADYGQKSAHRELAAAYALSMALGIPHRTIHLPFLREATRTALVSRDSELPTPSPEELDDAEAGRARAAAVWVPNRNGVLIAMAASWAETNDVPLVVCGFNREEGATFPDNTPEFLEAQNRALGFSTQNGVQVISPTITMTKSEVVRAGHAAGVPFDRIWSCYLGQDEPCGTCESCRRMRRAFEAADVPLPEPARPVTRRIKEGKDT